ncbi:unnamed protein product [Sphagnum troendelagicum]
MWSGIPVEQLTADEQNRLTNLEKMLCTCFIGQDAAVNGIAHAVQRAHVGEGYDTIGHESEYMERHTVSKLIACPPGYVGYGDGRALVRQSIKNLSL